MYCGCLLWCSYIVTAAEILFPEAAGESPAIVKGWKWGSTTQYREVGGMGVGWLSMSVANNYSCRHGQREMALFAAGANLPESSSFCNKIPLSPTYTHTFAEYTCPLLPVLPSVYNRWQIDNPKQIWIYIFWIPKIWLKSSLLYHKWLLPVAFQN